MLSERESSTRPRETLGHGGPAVSFQDGTWFYSCSSAVGSGGAARTCFLCACMLWWCSLAWPLPVPTLQGEGPALRRGGCRQATHTDLQACKGYKQTGFENKFAIKLSTVNFGSSTSEKQILTLGFILSVIQDVFHSETTFVLQWVLKTEIHRIWENTETLEIQSHLSFSKISSIISNLDSCYTKPNARVTVLEVCSLREFQKDWNLIKVNSEDLKY